MPPSGKAAAAVIADPDLDAGTEISLVSDVASPGEMAMILGEEMGCEARTVQIPLEDIRRDWPQGYANVSTFDLEDSMNLEDRFELQDLASRYAYYVDSFMAKEWLTVFTPDAVLDESEFGMGRYEGHEGLLGYAEAIAGRVAHLIHLMANQLIWEMHGDTARGTCFALVESMQKCGTRARYHVKYEDEYRRVDGRWLIHRRILRKSFPGETVTSL